MSVEKRILWAQLADAFKYWVYIPAAVIFGGKAADLIFELPIMPRHFLFYLIPAALIMTGVVFVQRSTKDLAVFGGGTPNPLRPPKRLVVEGSYSLCRHPMFFGYDLAALGVVLFFRSWGMLLISYPVFIFLGYRFLRQEERNLEKRFGDIFREYRRKAPLLIPLPLRERKAK